MPTYLEEPDGQMDRQMDGRTVGRKPIIIELAATEAAVKKYHNKSEIGQK